jgi:hypothetical protein
MEKNKTSKYFKYAIGEIILVVIGILIALQINNWNEVRKDLQKEQQILLQLKEDYKSNLIQLNSKIELRERIIQSSMIALNIIDDYPNSNRDSLINYVRIVLSDPTFDPISNELMTSGNLRLIQNDSLKRYLSNWTSDILALQEVEDGWQKAVQEIVAPYFLKAGIMRDVASGFWANTDMSRYLLSNNMDSALNFNKSKKPSTVEQIIGGTELEGTLSVAIIVNQTGNIQSVGVRNRILEILRLIELEIN